MWAGHRIRAEKTQRTADALGLARGAGEGSRGTGRAGQGRSRPWFGEKGKNLLEGPAQDMKMVWLPCTSLCVPGGHGVQVELLIARTAAEYEPAGHWPQTEAPVPAPYHPAPQSWQAGVWKKTFSIWLKKGVGSRARRHLADVCGPECAQRTIAAIRIGHGATVGVVPAYGVIRSQRAVPLAKR